MINFVLAKTEYTTSWATLESETGKEQGTVRVQQELKAGREKQLLHTYTDWIISYMQ